ncbi:hypothetical protein ACFT0G_06125 [Streptomyces sp. NPDC057020]|uniref:hypothetical protein n=1 Tax=unclassified Streptomyces TaxID=2593676 RepID=UPI003644A84C
MLNSVGYDQAWCMDNPGNPGYNMRVSGDCNRIRDAATSAEVFAGRASFWVLVAGVVCLISAAVSRVRQEIR